MNDFNFAQFYQNFSQFHQNEIHLQAHSHHWWPDSSELGHQRYWRESARKVDDKWSSFLGSELKKTTDIIKNQLHLHEKTQIAFAPNTHELVMRLISCLLKFNTSKPLNIVTTDTEFYSFSRQMKALEIHHAASVTYLTPSQFKKGTRELEIAPLFYQELVEKGTDADLIFLSHVFFLNGLKIDLKRLKSSIEELKLSCLKKNKKMPLICLDGYHSFCAFDFDLSDLVEDLFFLAGGYKYAQAGEGMCFLTIPQKALSLQPWFSGWFATFGQLATQDPRQESLDYSQDGMRFWGSTQDLSSHFRYQAVWDNFSQHNISIHHIGTYVKKLQKIFIAELVPFWKEQLVSADLESIGNFLTFKTNSNADTLKFQNLLKSRHIFTDSRQQYWRFGFGPYINDFQTIQAAQVLNSLVQF